MAAPISKQTSNVWMNIMCGCLDHVKPLPINYTNTAIPINISSDPIDDIASGSIHIDTPIQHIQIPISPIIYINNTSQINPMFDIQTNTMILSGLKVHQSSNNGTSTSKSSLKPQLMELHIKIADIDGNISDGSSNEEIRSNIDFSPSTQSETSFDIENIETLILSEYD